MSDFGKMVDTEMFNPKKTIWTKWEVWGWYYFQAVNISVYLPPYNLIDDQSQFDIIEQINNVK